MTIGDRLARGDRSATFDVGGHSKSELEWDLSVLTEREFLLKYVGTPRECYREMIEERMQGNA